LEKAFPLSIHFIWQETLPGVFGEVGLQSDKKLFIFVLCKPPLCVVFYFLFCLRSIRPCHPVCNPPGGGEHLYIPSLPEDPWSPRASRSRWRENPIFMIGATIKK
jgi:hypothetical protein